jgi:serine/threonine protein kinase
MMPRAEADMDEPVRRERDASALGKYRLVCQLGQGGMAEVWKAKISGPADFERTLVVKRILPHLARDPSFVEMFVAEARLSARLCHPNIVQVFELGHVDGEYFISMEYVHGVDLLAVRRAHLNLGLSIPVGLSAMVMRDVCRALGYAHGLADEYGSPFGIVHRDVTPSNIMVSYEGAIKLLDFGIAKASDSGNRTRSGILKGKFPYMAPELIEGSACDGRCDMFSAGVVLHEMLSGKRLFRGDTDMATLALVRNCNVQPPSAHNPNVPVELDQICMRALARDPKERFATCDDMARQLDNSMRQRSVWDGPIRALAMSYGSSAQSGTRFRAPLRLRSQSR